MSAKRLICAVNKQPTKLVFSTARVSMVNQNSSSVVL